MEWRHFVTYLWNDPRKYNTFTHVTADSQFAACPVSTIFYLQTLRYKGYGGIVFLWENVHAKQYAL